MRHGWPVVSQRVPARSGCPAGNALRGALAMDEAPLRRAVRQDERLLLNEVVADLVVDLDVRAEHLLRRRADPVDDDVPVGDGEVGGRVVVRPVLPAQRLVCAQPRVLAAVARQAARLRSLVEEVVRRLPAVPAAAAVDHDEHLARVAVALHLDEVVASADAAELRDDARVRPRDLVERHAVGHGDVLPLAEVGAHAERLRAEAQDLVRLPARERGHQVRPVAALARGDAPLDLRDPALAIAALT